MLIGEIAVFAGLLSYYGVEGSFVLQENFTDTLNEEFDLLSTELLNNKCPASNLTQSGISDLLSFIFPKIAEEKGFTFPFAANCSVYFLDKISKIECNPEFSNVHQLYYDGEALLSPLQHKYLTQENILSLSVVAGLPPVHHPQILYWFFPKSAATESESDSLSVTLSHTSNESTTESRNLSASQTKDQTLSANITESESELLSATLSHTSNASATETNSNSKTISLSHTQTKDVTLSVIATNSSSHSDSLTKNDTDSEASTDSNSQSIDDTFSLTISKDKTRTDSGGSAVTATLTKELPTPAPTPVPTPVPTPSCGIAAGCAYTAAETSSPPGSGLGSQNVGALTWQLGRFGSSEMNWSAAGSYCSSLGSGWRIPNIYELYALYQQKSVLGSDNLADVFWSSTVVAGSPSLAWGVYFYYGYVYNGAMSDGYCVRCVR